MNEKLIKQSKIRKNNKFNKIQIIKTIKQKIKIMLQKNYNHLITLNYKKYVKQLLSKIK